MKDGRIAVVGRHQWALGLIRESRRKDLVPVDRVEQTRGHKFAGYVRGPVSHLSHQHLDAISSLRARGVPEVQANALGSDAQERRR
jgi:hypothetical protein